MSSSTHVLVMFMYIYYSIFVEGSTTPFIKVQFVIIIFAGAICDCWHAVALRPELTEEKIAAETRCQ